MIDALRGSASNPPGTSLRHWLAMLALVALAYGLLGRLGISFAIEPGYASPIFPAAGFAVAALLWSSGRAWPGIFLGSFALNLATAKAYGGVELTGMLVAAGIATGATLQALMARWLLLRLAGASWKKLQTEREILFCLVLAGPLPCVISASTGISVLYAAGIVAQQDVAYVLLNWWLGDVLGVWILLPLSLALLYWRDALWRGRLAVHALPMVLVLGLVGAGFYLVSKWEREQVKSSIDHHGQALLQSLRQRFVAHQEALAALRRLVEVTPDMTYSTFEYFTRITLRDNPDIFALSINHFVSNKQRGSYEHSMRTPGGTFEIRERDEQRRLVSASARQEYVPVGFIAPRTGNAAAIGFDINSDPVRSDAIARARSSGRPAITAPVQLVQDQQKRTGVLVLHPAYAMDSALTASRALLGFAVGVIKVDEMAVIATAPIRVNGLNLRLEDVSTPAKPYLLYQSGGSAGATHADYLWHGELQVADRPWRLSAYPTDAYMQQQRHWMALLIGSGGLLMASLFQVLLLGITGRANLVQGIVRQQTHELQVKTAALEDTNAQLAALFALSPDGFVAVDHGGHIRFINPAFQTMSGIRAEDMLGQQETVLHAELRRHSETRGPVPSRSLRTFGDGVDFSLLHLKLPRQAVIQMLSIQSEASSIARILYFRDVTVESEVDQLKSEFLSTAAHELRTPMASVYGFAEVLMTHEMGEKERSELLGIIYKQSGRMADILNELLDLARIEARRGKDFVFETLQVQTLLQEALSGYKLPPQRSLPRMDLPTEPCFILADRSKACQVIMNVLSNAYKYSPQGGDVRVELVQGAQEDAIPALGLRISDFGIGMTPEQVSHMFERFYRADASGKIPGTGLGLSIVKEILDLHGGRVEVSSRPGLGTSVTLWFMVPMEGKTQNIA
jgi:signal transduction histidine kinase/integral membrane sensor domain MASE1